MTILYYVFWASACIIFYTYIGYGLVIWVWAKCIRLFRDEKPLGDFTPAVTLVVPAYNEAAILRSKIADCLAQDYPSDKLQLLFITDGSTDDPARILSDYPGIRHLHVAARGGKAMAENRAMTYVRTPYVVFTDCNTFLNRQAVREMVRHYQEPRVGAVSGEKKVLREASAAGNGEGLYWTYESFLKRCDSQIYSLMGAAGELVSFRTDLFQPLEPDTILDDFVQSFRVIAQGYRVVYEPLAYASEVPSASLAEEMERKTRICAGGWQAMARLTPLLNPLQFPVVSFLYVSHRVLRWSLTPVLLATLLLASLAGSVLSGGLYTLALGLQVLFYLAAGAGWLADKRGYTFGALLIPLYFTMMNLAVFSGFKRYVLRTQSAAWAKAQRYQPLETPRYEPNTESI
ncbi:glycosyltransferase family 2 protein [Pontibacter sp. E15-1]|uniref:glycosyltransferase family 2 protein n=1 Tax=Pontibacter sp. E15-1 TaxID=2919918 RepID=UPI001F4F1EFC|nr:glycosyltransferase family 2 protein [Pontibacter sp. E15-1]MCJ8163621.1 glycosyltransferase family 2 protein [Pontibacter sp. E15-1]